MLLERVDAEILKEGETVTLINWGNVIITKITRSVTLYYCYLYLTAFCTFVLYTFSDSNNTVQSLEAKLNLENEVSSIHVCIDGALLSLLQ